MEKAEFVVKCPGLSSSGERDDPVFVNLHIKVILWYILSYLNHISLLEEYPLMLVNMSH